MENCDAAELKFINPGPTRYGRDVATSPRAAVNKREQQVYQEYLTQLRLKASPNWNLAEAGVSASIPEDAGPRLQRVPV